MSFKKNLSASVGLLAVISTFAIGIPSYSADYQLQATLNTTAQNLDSLISSGISSGKLSVAQGANFRAQLSAITQAQASFAADGRLSSNEVSDLTQRFGALTTQVNSAVNSGVIGGGFGGGYGGGGYGGGFNSNANFGSNWTNTPAEFTTFANNLETAIQTNLAAGKLGAQQAASLRAQIASTVQMQNSFMADGRLSRSEASQLRDRFYNLNQAVLAQSNGTGGQWGNGNGHYGGGGWNHNGGVNGGAYSGAYIDNLQAQMQTKISTGISSRFLTRSEARSLQNEMSAIMQQESRLRVNGLNSKERMRLVTRLQDLNAKIDAQIADRQTAGGRHGGRGWY
jgi:hypothetical protein